MSPDETAHDLLRQLGLKDVTLARARDGREHHLFRVWMGDDERMLKFPRPDGLRDPHDPTRSPAERLRSEAWVVGVMKGVNVPSPYAVYDTEPPCALMGVIPGATAEMAYERGQLDEEMLIGVCVQMGRCLADIHRHRRPEGGGGVPDLGGADLTQGRLLHLDFHLGNVMGRPTLGMGWQVLGVVDWTCARWGPPEADLVEMEVSVFVSNPRARSAFIAGYRQVSGRAVDTAYVQARGIVEMERRLREDPPHTEALRRVWEGAVTKARRPPGRA